MREIRGQLWDHLGTATVCITTNGFVKTNGACVMGRGCAQQARDMYPGIDMRLGELIQRHGNRCFRLTIDPTIVSFPVKHKWMEEADIELIKKSCGELMAMSDKFGWNNVVLPRPGCGNGRLTWTDVKSAISPLLDDRIAVITFPRPLRWEMPQKKEVI